MADRDVKATMGGMDNNSKTEGNSFSVSAWIVGIILAAAILWGFHDLFFSGTGNGCAVFS
jgi:hypothetical protein